MKTPALQKRKSKSINPLKIEEKAADVTHLKKRNDE